MEAVRSEKNRIYTCAVLFIILAGAAVRLLFAGSFPPGLNQDEASAGYEAWALMYHGIDRCGAVRPVLFTSWGSGQNVLYSYLSMPFIRLMGLNTASLRLLAGTLGSASLILFYLLGRRLGDRRSALWALAALSINPWHISVSRWALESNILPFFLLAGIFFLVVGEERRYAPVLAALSLALGLYAYGTGFVVLPFFLAGMCVLLLCRRRRGRRVMGAGVFFAAAAVFALVSLPIVLCNAVNVLGLEETRLLGLTLPRLTQTRQSATMWASAGNFAKLMKLLWTQSDGLPWNSVGRFGLLYGKAGLALCAVGLAAHIRELVRARAKAGESYILLMLISCAAASFFIDVNVNRMNMIFLPLIWYQGRGICALCRLFGRGRRLAETAAAALVTLSAVLMTCFYFTSYSRTLAPLFFDGLGGAISCAASFGEDVWVTQRVNMPYIYVLFYRQIPPEQFIDEVDYVNPQGAFRQVQSMGRWHFSSSPPPGAVYVGVANDPVPGELLARSGGYAVKRTRAVFDE